MVKITFLRPVRQPIYDTEPLPDDRSPREKYRPRRCRSHKLKIGYKRWNAALKD